MPTRCQFSPSTTPIGVHASGTSHALTCRFSGTRLEANASVLAFPPSTYARASLLGSLTLGGSMGMVTALRVRRGVGTIPLL